MAGSGDEEDEANDLVPFDIPFNASHDLQPERQLATHMLANGSSAAATYAAVAFLLAEAPATILVETCAKRPFYMISKMSLKPPLSTALVIPSHKPH